MNLRPFPLCGKLPAIFQVSLSLVLYLVGWGILAPFPPLRSPWAWAAEVGVLVPSSEWIEELRGCTGTILRNPNPLTDPERSRKVEIWEGALARTERAYTLLDFEGAEAELTPVLLKMREEGYWGKLRLKGELLLAKLAMIQGLPQKATEAIHNLALLHLYRAPDPSLIPPEVRGEVEKERERIFSQGTSVVHIVPPPLRLELNGTPLPPSEPVTVPRVPDLLWELAYPSLGTVLLFGVPPQDPWEPLVEPVVLGRLFPQGIPPYLLTETRKGLGVHTYPDLRLLSGRGQELCAALVPSQVVPPPPEAQAQRRSEPVYRQPWFYWSLGGAAVLTGVGVFLWLRANQKETTGAIVITW